MFRFTLNLQPLELRLESLAERLGDLHGLLERVAPLVARAIQRNFDEQGRPVRWPPLAPATLRRKPAGLRILERTGGLRRSIRTEVQGNAIVASTAVPYAAAQQFGLSRAESRGVRGRLPARPFLVLTREDEQEVAEAIAQSLTEN